jgi:hypothetical protein
LDKKTNEILRNKIERKKKQIKKRIKNEQLKE